MHISKGPYWHQPQSALELGEGAITELLSTQGKAAGPVVKVSHEPDLLGNPKPHNWDPSASQQVKLASLLLNNLTPSLCASTVLVNMYYTHLHLFKNNPCPS